MPRTAFLSGISGQDGSYLAELLLEKGYVVHGLIRRSSLIGTGRIAHLYEDPHEADARLFLHYGDITDGTGLSRLLEKIKPDEIYNLAAQSHVKVSFDMPVYTADATAIGALRLLEAVRETNLKVRYYQASSSEMYGNAVEATQNESTPFHPRSVYACSKVFAHWATVNFREAYGLFACNGILMNHESPRRGETFVTRKITKGVADIVAGKTDTLYLGNLDARRDWGYAKEFVEAMWLMLQQDQPDDYVISTGVAHSVREFLEICFNYVGLDYHAHVKIDPRYYRPTEVDCLLGDSTKAREKLGWKPSTSFHELAILMLRADLANNPGTNPLTALQASTAASAQNPSHSPPVHTATCQARPRSPHPTRS